MISIFNAYVGKPRKNKIGYRQSKNVNVRPESKLFVDEDKRQNTQRQVDDERKPGKPAALRPDDVLYHYGDTVHTHGNEVAYDKNAEIERVHYAQKHYYDVIINKNGCFSPIHNTTGSLVIFFISNGARDKINRKNADIFSTH